MGDLALVGLGGNLGDRAATLDRAVDDLGAATGVGVRAVSTYHTTTPVGGPGGQGAFLNAAVLLETTRDPAALHHLLLDIERHAGRTRDVRWGARTLDLDLILFGDRVIDTTELAVPHPRMAVRRFVLAPMAEIAPDAIDPMTGRTILGLLRNLDRRPGYLAIDARPGSDPLAEVADRVADALGGRALGLPEPTVRHVGIEGRLNAVLDRAALAGGLLDEAVRDRAGPGWIVSRFCMPIDRLRLSTSLAIEACRRPDRTSPDRLNPWARRVTPDPDARADHPTFCVLRGWGWSGRAELAGRIGAPIIVPEASDPDAIVTEILAACASCRP